MSLFFMPPSPVKANPEESPAEKFWSRAMEVLGLLQVFTVTFTMGFREMWLFPTAVQPVMKTCRKDGKVWIRMRGLEIAWLFLTIYFCVRCPLEPMKSSEELIEERIRAERVRAQAERLKDGDND